MGEGYHVVSGVLELASDVFDAEGRQVGVAAAGFVAGARLPEGAFGNLPDSYKLANQYAAFFVRVQGDLRVLQDSLAGCAGRLQATAQNYLRAEAANTLPGV